MYIPDHRLYLHGKNDYGGQCFQPLRITIRRCIGKNLIGGHFNYPFFPQAVQLPHPFQSSPAVSFQFSA